MLVGLLLGGLAALLAFLLANPYSLLDFHSFEQGIAHQSTVSQEAEGKLGAPHESGIVYYLWSLTWGLGWVPALAALGGAVTVWWRERALGWLLVPAPLLYLAFMGAQGRYFGRWLLPAFPILCLLAALFALQLARAAARLIARLAARADRGMPSGAHTAVDRPPRAGRGMPSGAHTAADQPPRAGRGMPSEAHTAVDRPPRVRGAGRPAPSAAEAGTLTRTIPKASPPRVPRALSIACTALAAVALCGQGAVYSVHSGLVLSRADTRNLTRAWMQAHIPLGARIVVEPLVPDGWVQDVGRPTFATSNGDRWIKYSSLVSLIDAAGTLHPAQRRVVSIENYEKTLSPALIGWYEHEGYCWIVSGYSESGRAQADPGQVPHAVAYYDALARHAEVVYRASPYRARDGPVAFNFDWTFDYYPLAYHRPGPEMTVYRLRGGSCRS